MSNVEASRYKRNDQSDNSSSVDQQKRKKGRKMKKSIGSSLDDQEVDERKVSALVMWYLPVIDRLKRLFSNSRGAELMIWHAVSDGGKTDGKLGHPMDARQ